ncbi:hypothetical protein HDU86_001027 [Geranomyces michiganensis]|nr:hypothetical protein HDU86_001027 [Geranomyces michiganensis]
MPDSAAAQILGESMTRTFDDVEEEKAFHVARAILMDFFHMVRYAPRATLPAHAAERKFLIEHIAPALKAIEHTYAVLKFKCRGKASLRVAKRVEVQSQATKEVNLLQNPGASNASTYSVDIIGVTGADESELAFVEQSGGPGVFARSHTSEGSVKVTNESINGCKARLREFLDAPAQSVTKLASLGLQIIRSRLTLFSVSIVGKGRFVAVDLKSCKLPLSWEEVDCMEDLCDLLLCCVQKAREQHQLASTLRRECRRAGREGIAGETCRDWF